MMDEVIFTIKGHEDTPITAKLVIDNGDLCLKLNDYHIVAITKDGKLERTAGLSRYSVPGLQINGSRVQEVGR